MHTPNKVGLVIGALYGGFHLVWAVLVYAGVAQAVLNFIFWAHMVSLPILVRPFDGTPAVMLIVVTAAMGYVAGYIGAWVWNRIHRV